MAGNANQADLAKEVAEHQLDEVDKRILELRKLPEQAAQMGPEKTRKTLLPQTTEKMEQESERVVREYAKLLSQMIPEVGGKQHINVLIENLQTIIGYTFMTISSDDREQLAAALITLSKELTTAEFDKMLLPLLMELSEDIFIKKCLCAPLLPTAYQKTGKQKDIYNIFVNLCTDSADVVVQSASAVLSEMIDLVPQIDDNLQNVVKKLAVDSAIPNTRINAVTGFVHMMSRVPQPKREPLIAAVLRPLMHDKSDDVKVAIADKMVDLQKAVGHPSMIALVKYVVAQLEKGGTRMKVKALERLPAFVKNFPKEEHVQLLRKLTCLKELTQLGDKPEKTEPVRIALATCITSFAEFVDAGFYNSDYLPIIEDLMQDESPKVREALVTNIQPVVALVGQDRLVKSFANLISEMTTHANWRVRNSVINALAIMRFPTETVVKFVNTMLKDQCGELRQSAAFLLKNVLTTKDTGRIDPILNQIIAMATTQDRYKLRITALKAMEGVMQSGSANFADTRLIPYLLPMADDKVANVRQQVAICAAAALKCAAIAKHKPNLTETLKKLSKDKDAEVALEAQELLQKSG